MNRPRYTVRRLGWYQPPHGDPYTRRVPTAVTVAVFDTFDDAEMHRRALEAECRAGENPFRFGGSAVFFQSSLDGPRLHDWLMDTGIEPPTSELRHGDWRAWWDAFAHTWNDEQLAHAWAALDKVRFFDVVEEPPGAVVPLIQEVRYVDRESWLPIETFGGALEINNYPCPREPVGEPDAEGGFPLRACRTARRAAAVCEEMNRDPHRRPEYLTQFRWLQTTARRRAGRPTVFEAVEVPGDVSPGAAIVFLVQRRAFGASGHVCHGRHGRDTGSRVPVRLFNDRAAAVAHRDELMAAAVAVMNPFQVYTPPMSGLIEGDFLAAVAQLRPPLPWPTGFRLADWVEWWDLCQDDATDEQRAGAWALFADHPLFEVLRVEVTDE